MTQYIKNYIEDKRHQWAETTQKSELSRLLKIAPLLAQDASPNEVLDFYLTKHKSKYSAKTLLIRIGEFYAWLEGKGLKTGPNQFKDFMHNNYGFKNAYKKQELSISYEEAKSRISFIEDSNTKNWAKFMLETGVRLFEVYRVKIENEQVSVIGKQGKERKIFKIPPAIVPPSRIDFQRALKQVGLTPKVLRKLFASMLDQRGVALKDLMEIMGWSAVQTADSYLQKSKEERLKKLVSLV